MSVFEVRKFPEKSWSISKMKVIEECYRSYFYTYYGSHNGWLKDSNEEQKVAWRLKKLTNIWLMFGDKLHITIKNIIDNKKYDIQKDMIKNNMRQVLNEGVKESATKATNGTWDEYPKGEMLQEYYYDGKLDKDDINKIKDRIESCTENFLRCKTYLDIKGADIQILEVDEGKFEYIIVHNVKIFALIDTLYIDSEGNYVIVDWKTGAIGEHDREQLLVYVLYVMKKYNVSLEKIKGRVEYLNLGKNQEFSFGDKDIIYIKDRIKEDLNVIDAFLEEKEANKPKPKEYFRKTENLKKCLKCKYKKICLNESEEW